MSKKNEDVTAESVKNVLWETLQGVKRKQIKSDEANAISKLANGITAIAKLEHEASKFYGLQSVGLNKFLEAKGEKPKTYLSTEEAERKALEGQDVQAN